MERTLRRLTRRESDILTALCSGLTAHEAGERPGLSTRGVSSRRSIIYQKLHAVGLADTCVNSGFAPDVSVGTVEDLTGKINLDS